MRRRVQTLRARRRLLRDEGGATAVEFAMIAMPFFFMIFAIIELGLVFVLDTALDNAVQQTSRQIRTGQAQTMSEGEFVQQICNRMSVFAGDCPGRLSVDVRVLPTFANQTPPDPMATGSFSDAGMDWDTGQAGQIVLVTGWYQHPLITPMMSEGLSRIGGGKALMTATAAFRNEPFVNVPRPGS